MLSSKMMKARASKFCSQASLRWLKVICLWLKRASEPSYCGILTTPESGSNLHGYFFCCTDMQLQIIILGSALREAQRLCNIIFHFYEIGRATCRGGVCKSV